MKTGACAQEAEGWRNESEQGVVNRTGPNDLKGSSQK